MPEMRLIEGFPIPSSSIITKIAFVILGLSQLVFVINIWKVIFPNPFASLLDSSSESEGKSA